MSKAPKKITITRMQKQRPCSSIGLLAGNISLFHSDQINVLCIIIMKTWCSMKRNGYLSVLCDAFEAEGRLVDAWQIAAEIAQSNAHELQHPIHDRLLKIEKKMQALLAEDSEGALASCNQQQWKVMPKPGSGVS